MKNFTILLVVFTVSLLETGRIYGQLQGQLPLNPKSIPQFVDPLPHFAGNRVDASGGNLIVRHVANEQIAVSTGTILANGTVGITPGAGKARFWTYSISKDGGATFTTPNWPAFTIEAKKGVPVNVTYENKLDNETYSSVNLVADQTLHWAAPLGMDMGNTMPYDGPIPVVPHLHGGEVASESDGGPDSWFTPGYTHKGPSWGIGGTDEKYYYPNSQEEATLWWHDHSLGATRLNVYAGLAGFYLLRGPDEERAKLPGWSGDDKVQEVLKNGQVSSPYLPEIEVVFQDRMFDQNGGLYFPNLPTNPAMHPYWTPEFIGDIITVNGKTWPYLSVAPRKYRFRLLNGSNARFYEIWLQDLATGTIGPQIVQIGTDGGLLDSPVPIAGKLLLAPGERADVVIDFSTSVTNQVWTLKNSANTPFPKGGPPNGSTTGRLMQFVVNGKMVSASDPRLAGTDKSQLPTSLRSSKLVRLTNFSGITNVVPAKKRQLTLNEVMGMGGPLEVLINNTKWDANGENPGLGDTEIPVEGTTELWQIVNLTADAHPIHLHLVQFQLVGRQKFNLNNFNKAYIAAFGGAYVPAEGPPLPYNSPNADGALGGNPAIKSFLQGPVKPALLNEMGWKDTYTVYPGEVTTFVVRFAPTHLPVTTAASELQFDFDPSEGPGYVWHCHIIDHEDNEMMRPYSVQSSAYRTSLLGYSNPLITKLNQTADIKSVDATTTYVLEQNFPNPVVNYTEIKFSIPAESHVRLTLYNRFGEPVKLLIDSKAPAGTNIVKVDVGDLQEGIYYYQLKAGSFTETRKMIVGK